MDLRKLPSDKEAIKSHAQVDYKAALSKVFGPKAADPNVSDQNNATGAA